LAAAEIVKEIAVPLWKIFYHAVWATQYREARISEEVEPFVYGLLRTKAHALDARIFALNGMPDHVHLVFSVHPKVAPAAFLGSIKGYSSNRINQAGVLDSRFFWQDEYAIYSFDAKRLPYHVAYVENQKSHHAQATVIPALERTSETQD
jgi:putative transposase